MTNRASYFGHGIPVEWLLEPDEEITVTLKHKESPVWSFGTARLWTEDDASEKEWIRLYAEGGVTLPARKFFHRGAFGQPGPLPLSYTKEKVD